MLLLLLRLLACLPLSVLHGLGRFAGGLIYALPGKYRTRLRANATQAGYPEAVFARRAAREAGAMILELAYVWLRTPQAVARVEVDDAADLHEALADPRGILFLTPHLGCYDITARWLAQHRAMTVMYRPPRKSYLAPILSTIRNTEGLTAVPATMQGVRAFVRTLKQGHSIGMLPDQVPNAGDGVWVPFFDRPAFTTTLPGRLARQTKVPVVMVAGERLPGGRGWRLHHLRLPDPLPESPEEQARLINAAMETLIRRCPQQYLWSYNRYKQPHKETARHPDGTSPSDADNRPASSEESVPSRTPGHTPHD